MKSQKFKIVRVGNPTPQNSTPHYIPCGLLPDGRVSGSMVGSGSLRRAQSKAKEMRARIDPRTGQPTFTDVYITLKFVAGSM